MVNLMIYITQCFWIGWNHQMLWQVHLPTKTPRHFSVLSVLEPCPRKCRSPASSSARRPRWPLLSMLSLVPWLRCCVGWARLEWIYYTQHHIQQIFTKSTNNEYNLQQINYARKVISWILYRYVQNVCQCDDVFPHTTGPGRLNRQPFSKTNSLMKSGSNCFLDWQLGCGVAGRESWVALFI